MGFEGAVVGQRAGMRSSFEGEVQGGVGASEARTSHSTKCNGATPAQASTTVPVHSFTKPHQNSHEHFEIEQYRSKIGGRPDYCTFCRSKQALPPESTQSEAATSSYERHQTATFAQLVGDRKNTMTTFETRRWYGCDFSGRGNIENIEKG